MIYLPDDYWNSRFPWRSALTLLAIVAFFAFLVWFAWAGYNSTRPM